MATEDEKTIKVASVIGPTIKGGGALNGLIAIRVQTGGCDYKCVWCDQLNAVLPQFESKWRRVYPVALVNEVEELASRRPSWILMTGGNPAMQPARHFLREAQTRLYKVAVETQGSYFADWLRFADHLILSPKAPSSQQGNDWGIFDAILTNMPMGKTSLEITVFSEADFEFAIDVIKEYYFHDKLVMPAHIVIGNPNPPHFHSEARHGKGVFEPGALAHTAQMILNKLHGQDWPMNHIRVSAQTDTLLWGNRKAN